VVGVEEVALGVDAGGAASSGEVQAIAAVITSAATPVHVIRRSIWSSLPSYGVNPAKIYTTIRGPGRRWAPHGLRDYCLVR
jgi:hypothetical protein